MVFLFFRNNFLRNQIFSNHAADAPEGLHHVVSLRAGSHHAAEGLHQDFTLAEIPCEHEVGTTLGVKKPHASISRDSSTLLQQTLDEFRI
ncbi:hypothetical protein RYX36_007517 [Vicia faba]